jgi:hypothetical protein
MSCYPHPLGDKCTNARYAGELPGHLDELVVTPVDGAGLAEIRMVSAVGQ